MKFFTNTPTKRSRFALTQLKDLSKACGKEEIMIDPGVYELVKNVEYKHINALHEKCMNLAENELISIDYPCDMNPKYEQHFIDKSIANNLRYIDLDNYICTIQSKFMDFDSFRQEFDFLNEKVLKQNQNKVVGVGNLCRLMLNPKRKTYPLEKAFCEKVVQYLTEHLEPNRKIHFYGVSKRFITELLPALDIMFDISIDSTKWTRRVHTNPPLDKAICCRKDTRDLYFTEYIRVLQGFFDEPIEY